MGLLLFIVSLLLTPILFPVGLLFGIFMAFYKRHFRTGYATADFKLRSLAIGLDKYGNIWCAELFNATLITRQSWVPFGDLSQTISAVIGYNLLCGTLSPLGRTLNRILNFFEKDHALKAIGYYS
jgi:hypothetical protein